ncbi:hypothetical protein V1512DRAFT_257460 [Lipomyces arxii]|uniref:uncharacterized protein n=1 Tax=Lipomyces arxii TaxID=56418 RepID=UPI0034CD3ACF
MLIYKSMKIGGLSQVGRMLQKNACRRTCSVNCISLHTEVLRHQYRFASTDRNATLPPPKKKPGSSESAKQVSMRKITVYSEEEMRKILDSLPDNVKLADPNTMKDYFGKSGKERIKNEEVKPPSDGMIAGLGFVFVMALCQGFHVFEPETWADSFTVQIPETPITDKMIFNPYPLAMSFMAPSNTIEWLANSYVGFFTIRTLIMVFGGTITTLLATLAALWASRVTVAQGERRFVKQIETEDNDGTKSTRFVEYRTGVEKATTNTPFVFSLGNYFKPPVRSDSALTHIAAFAACVAPNTLLPFAGPAPLMSLPLLGVLCDAVYLFQLRSSADPSEARSVQDVLSRADPTYLLHIYGVLGGAVSWFGLARWTTTGKQVRMNSRAIRRLLTSRFMPDKNTSWARILTGRSSKS